MIKIGPAHKICCNNYVLQYVFVLLFLLFLFSGCCLKCLNLQHFLWFLVVGRCIEEGRSKKYPPAQGPPIGPSCDQCSSKFHLGGPLWTAPIHDTAFVNTLLKSIKECPKLFNTSERIVGEWCRVCGVRKGGGEYIEFLTVL